MNLSELRRTDRRGSGGVYLEASKEPNTKQKLLDTQKFFRNAGNSFYMVIMVVLDLMETETVDYWFESYPGIKVS